MSPVGPIEIYPSAPRNTDPPGHVPFLPSRARGLYVSVLAAGELYEAGPSEVPSAAQPSLPASAGALIQAYRTSGALAPASIMEQGLR